MEPTDLTEREQNFMELAFEHARRALEAQEVPVGCVFLRDREIIAVGRNEVNETRNATRHAELICVDQVVEYSKRENLPPSSVFKEIEVYVTVEPCIMCTAALYQLEVKSVFFGCRNDRFGGLTVFDVAGVLNPVTKVCGGYRAEEAMNLLKEFYKGTNPSAPACKAKVKGKMVRDETLAATSTNCPVK